MRWLPAVLVVVLTGCTPLIQKDTQTVLQTGLNTLTSPENQALIAGLLPKVDLDAETRALTQAVLSESRKELSNEEWDALAQRLAERLAAGVMPVVANSVKTDLGPAVQQQLVAAIRASLDVLTGPHAQVQMGALATAVAGDVVDVVGPKLSKEAARGLREDLAPALADALREDLVRDDAVVRLATRDAMLGVADALNGPLGEALHDFSARERTDLLDAADAAGSKWESRFYAGIGALGALLLASVGLVVARSIEARRSTQAVHLLTTTIKSYEHDPAVHALAGKIKEQSGTGGAGIYLQKFFNKHPELKVKHPEKS